MSGISLVSHWDMSTINPPDLGWRQLGNNGVGVGLDPATDVVDGIAGGKAIEFDGSERIDVAAAVDMNGASISLWVKRTNLAATMYLFDDRNSTGGTAYAFMVSGVDTVGVPGGAIRYIDGVPGVFLTPYAWHLLVITNLNIVGDNLYIAEFHAGAQRWIGVLDKIMIFDKILTPLQVTDLYERQRKGIW